jgi:uncharacterized protein YaiE (UPF0345 family)
MSVEFRIIDDIMTQRSDTLITASSSDSSFPVANLKKEQRSAVWRSNGNYVITTSNNKIDFKESGGGPELTATLAAGTYTAATLATEIKTKMEAVNGADTITVSRSASTGKWTISTSGAFLSILFSTGTNAATSARSVIGFGSNDFTGATSYIGASVALHTEEWVKFDLLTPTDIDSCVLVFDKLQGAKLSSLAVVKIQGNATDSWASPSVNVTLTFDETPEIYSYFWITTQTFRYWRVNVVDPANPNLYVELSKVILGKATQLSRAPDNGFSIQYSDNSKVDATPYGHEYADIYPVLMNGSFDYTALPYVDAKILQEIYLRVGNVTPVCIVLDSAEALFDKDRMAIYGKLSGDNSYRHQVYDYFNAGLQIREIP